MKSSNGKKFAIVSAIYHTARGTPKGEGDVVAASRVRSYAGRAG
ncbi:MAG: hypothetical protein WAM91_09405 [Candidatus Acidiferrales bacterium]